MSFWERFVIWLYASMADLSPVGQDPLGRLFVLAFQRGHLVPASINDLSPLLILAARPGESSLQVAMEQEVNRRSLDRHPQRLWQLLQAIRPPRVSDILEIGRQQPLLRGLVAEVLHCSELRTNLCTFLGRLFLRDPAGEQSRASQFLVQATVRYYRIPQGTVDFTCRLYRHLVPQLLAEDEAIPSVLAPGPRPAWWTALEDAEQGFLDRCLNLLPEPELVLLYLQFYAHLPIKQIAGVMQAADATWTADQVAQRLEECWQTVL
jgi:hypothetical protein